jgi:hypothetical protein
MQAILIKDLGIRCVSANFIPWLLTQEQKKNHLPVASDLLEYEETNDSVFKDITIGDETQVYSYKF